jgi:hypothetical protein
MPVETINMHSEASITPSVALGSHVDMFYRISTTNDDLPAVNSSNLLMAPGIVEPNDEDMALLRVVTADSEAHLSTCHQHQPQQLPSPNKPPNKPFSNLSPTKECKFGESTLLISFIHSNHYNEAIHRLNDHPEEASQWAKTVQGDLSYERLPVHIACSNLTSALEAVPRFHLEQLILRLVVAYPKGCSMVDYDNRLPLHAAIWNNASPETVAMMLMADPTSLLQRDPCGRNAAEVNRHCDGIFKDQVQRLLSRGVQYWESVRHSRWGTGPLPKLDVVSASKLDAPPRLGMIGSLCIPNSIESSAYDSSLTLDDSIMSETTVVPSVLACSDTLMQDDSLPRNEHTSPILNRTVQFGHEGQEILQNMLKELLEQNKQLSCTVQELAKTNAQLLRTETPQGLSSKLVLTSNDSLETPVSLPLNTRPGEETHHNFKENADPVMAALRAQNAALKRKCDRLKSHKKKQADKIDFLKRLLASEDVFLDISDSHSDSTYSLFSAGVTSIDCYSTTKGDDASSFDNSVSGSECSSPKSLRRCEVPFSGLVTSRFEAYISRLQQQIGKDTREANVHFIDDSLEIIFCQASQLYLDHVKNCPWQTGELILQWEQPLPIPPARSNREAMPSMTKDEIGSFW